MITLAQWRQQGELESINGQQIFTRTGGDKSAPALVLIHGYPSASWDWEGMWQALTQRYRQLISNASNANDVNVTELTQLGHYPQLEDAEAVTTAYLQFRDSLNQS
ncbi:hypothetical protein [uncultured Psychrobacter sp.]|uniref:alpha/beta fold hydrolase n=1 Tax=uncultured Psychrobacter sp. TaxID=259303 RepID=UPI00262C83C8|nr:hypothetical protein [uncultured Psychrobacter sp.]